LVRAQSRGEFVEPTKRTVAEWLSEWHEKVVTPTRKRRTAMMYDRMIQSTLTPKLGSIRLQQLKVIDVNEFVASLTKEGYRTPTVRLALATLSSALDRALTDNLVTRTVVKLLGRNGRPSLPRPERRLSANTWTAHEARTFLAEASKCAAVRSLRSTRWR